MAHEVPDEGIPERAKVEEFRRLPPRQAASTTPLEVVECEALTLTFIAFLGLTAEADGHEHFWLIVQLIAVSGFCVIFQAWSLAGKGWRRESLGRANLQNE